MNQSNRPRLSPVHGSIQLAAGLLLAAAWSSQGLQAQQAQTSAKLDPAMYPSQQLLRDIQLEVIACGRDNTAPTCDKARAMADPLMDHPLLSGACKDVVWSVLEGSVVAAKNTYERREALNRDAGLLTTRCKKATKPVGSGATTAKEDNKKPGGLGGFLRGLGIGGGGSSKSE